MIEIDDKMIRKILVLFDKMCYNTIILIQMIERV